MEVDPPDARPPTATRASREQVDELLVSLADRWGPFDVRELTWKLTTDEYSQFRERHDAGHSGGAGVWVQSPDGVLMVRHENDSAWSDPGGKREQGESYAQTAIRETAEETGIDVDLTGILETHLITHQGPSDEPPLISPIVIFEGRPIGGELRPKPGEIAEVKWMDTRPDTVLYEALETFPMPD